MKTSKGKRKVSSQRTVTFQNTNAHESTKDMKHITRSIGKIDRHRSYRKNGKERTRTVNTVMKKKTAITGFLGLGRAKRVTRDSVRKTASETSTSDVDDRSEDDRRYKGNSSEVTTRETRKNKKMDISYIVNWQPDLSRFSKKKNEEATAPSTSNQPNVVSRSHGDVSVERSKDRTHMLLPAGDHTNVDTYIEPSTETLDMCNMSATSDVEMDLSSSSSTASVESEDDDDEEEESVTTVEHEEQESEDENVTILEHAVSISSSTTTSSSVRSERMNSKDLEEKPSEPPRRSAPKLQQATHTTKKLPNTAAPKSDFSVFRPSPVCAPFGRIDRRTPTGSDKVPIERKTTVSDDGETSVPKEYRSLINQDNVVKVDGESFLGVSLVGKGGSSKVYKVFGPKWQVYALKYVQLKRVDRRTVAAYRNEIKLLEKLRGKPSIIQMKCAEINIEKKLVMVVMEYGQLDLNRWLKKKLETRNFKSGKCSHITPHDINELRLIWQQMLTAVNVIHEARIVHGDLKPANFVFVCGVLKLIDFGIAKQIESNDTTNIVRDSQVGTLNFMAPEALGRLSGTESPSASTKNNSATAGSVLKLSRSSDIWSLGCILYQLVYGRPPFASLSLLPKMRAILDPNHKIVYPELEGDGGRSSAMSQILSVMKSCLRRKPETRPTITGANGLLKHSMLWPTSSAKKRPVDTEWIESIVGALSSMSKEELQVVSRTRKAIATALCRKIADGDRPSGDLKSTILPGSNISGHRQTTEDSRRRPFKLSSASLCQGKENLRRGSKRKKPASKSCAGGKDSRKKGAAAGRFALKSSLLKKQRSALQPLEKSKSARFMKADIPKGTAENGDTKLGAVLRRGLSRLPFSSKADEDRTDGVSWTLDGTGTMF
eukprot:g3368.t1